MPAHVDGVWLAMAPRAGPSLTEDPLAVGTFARLTNRRRHDPTRDALEAVDGIKAISATPAKPYGPKDHECLDREHVFLGVWKDGAVVRLKY